MSDPKCRIPMNSNEKPLDVIGSSEDSDTEDPISDQSTWVVLILYRSPIFSKRSPELNRFLKQSSKMLSTWANQYHIRAMHGILVLLGTLSVLIYIIPVKILTKEFSHNRTDGSLPFVENQYQYNNNVLILCMKAKNEAIKLINSIPQDGLGGAPVEKGIWFVETIIRDRLKICVEIGVWRGRSFIPIIIASKYIDGHAIGIDSYSSIDAKELEAPDSVLKDLPTLIQRTDFENIYRQLQTTLRTNFDRKYFTIIRKRAKNAINDIPFTIDFLHIDGNHDQEQVASDINLYVPRVRKYGWIILDDTDWSSVKSASKLLLNYNAEKRHDFGFWQAWLKKV